MKWYYNDGSSQQGPFTEAQFNALIKGGLIKADTYIWKDGLADWQTLQQFLSLQADPVNVQPTGVTASSPETALDEQTPILQSKVDSGRAEGNQFAINLGVIIVGIILMWFLFTNTIGKRVSPEEYMRSNYGIESVR